MKTPKTSRTRTSARILAGSIAALLAVQSAFAQNTVNNYTGAATGSLLVTTNWSLGALPLVTNDAVFPLGAGGGIRTLTAGNLTVGSFNVVANTNTFSIRNETSTATDSNLTLGGVGNLGNSVGGAGDLLYAASGSTFNITGANGGGGTGLLNLILGQSGNFNIAGTAASTISAVISDGGSGYALTKAGAGTLTFNGSAAHTFTGGLAVRGGTLALDFANLGTPTNLIAGGNALTFGSGGAMTLKAKTGVVTTDQTFNGVTVNAGGGSLLVDTLSAGGNTNVNLGSLGTLSSWVKGSSLALGKANTNPSGALAITTTTDYDAQSIYGGRIVLASGVANTGYDWATRDSSVGSGPFTLAAFGAGGNFGTYSPMVDGATTDTLNTGMTANRSLSGAHTHNSLKIDSGRTLALNGFLLTLTSGGLLSTGTAESTISGTAGATRLTAGADSGYDLIVHQYNNSTNGLTISAQIGDNGVNAVSVTKAGTGNLVLSGNNTFTGGVNWNTGKLLLGHDTALGAGGTFTINGGSIGATANRIIANPVSINGDFTYTKQSSSANLLFTGAVDLGSAPGGARTINISGANSDQHYSFTIRGVISNGPAGGGNALIKAGNGHLFLTGHNTYTGGTTVTGGDEWSALYIGHNNALGTGTLSLNGGAIMAYGESPRTITNNVLWGGSFNFGGTNVTFQDLTITGTTNTGTIARTVTIASNAKTTLGAVTYAGDHTFSFSNATAKSLEMTGDVTLTGGNRTFTVSTAATLGNALVISGAVKEDVAGRGLTKAGTGVLVLSGNSNYSGTTTISAGPLRATSGTGLPITSHISLGGGVLELTGNLTARTLATTAGTNTLQWGTGGFAAFGGARNVNFSSGAALTWGTTSGFVSGNMILSSTTADANLDFQNPIDLNNAARTVQVDNNADTAADFATLSGVISSTTAASGALTKTGTGTLVLSNSNTYEGTTTINAGALRAVSGTGLPTNSLLSFTGGVLEGSGVGSFTRTIANSAGNVFWTGNGGFAANGGKLTVTPSGGTIDFGAAAGFNAKTLIFGSSTANAEVELTNDINLADATRTVQVDDNAYSGTDFAKISGVISSSTPASGLLTKTGTGTLVLSGTNTYAGATTISAGALRANDNAGLPGTGSTNGGSYLKLDGGVLEGSGVTSFTRANSTTAGGGNFNWTTNGGGFSANGGKMTVNIGGAAATQTWDTAVGNDKIVGTLKFGSATANAETDFTNPINLNNGARTFSVEDNPHSTADFARISALINSSPAGGGITKSGTGLLVIDNASYTGATTINGGVLRMSLANLAGAGVLTISGGGILETSGVFTRQLTSAAGATNLNLAGNGGFSAFGGTLEINLRGQVTPVLVPWNDNFGGGGQRTADSVNGNDCRRMYSNNAVMVLNSIYSDSMVNWRNPLALGWNSGLTADTAGVRYSAGKIRDIQVNDNPLLNTDFARLSGEISDGAAPASNNGIRKSGTGLLELTAANTYTGKTLVDAGTLAAVNTTALGTAASGTIVANGATLDVRANIGSEAISVVGSGVGGAGALITATTLTGTVGGTVTLTGATSIGGAGTGILNINGIVAAGANTLTTLGTGETTFGAASTLTSVANLAVTDGTTNVNSPLGTAGNAVVAVSDIAGGNPTKLRFGSVSQTLSSLTIGAGSTVIFTSGAASGSLAGDDGGGKAAGFGSPASSFGGGATVPEPGTLGLLLVGALGMLNRRRRQA